MYLAPLSLWPTADSVAPLLAEACRARDNVMLDGINKEVDRSWRNANRAADAVFARVLGVMATPATANSPILPVILEVLKVKGRTANPSAVSPITHHCEQLRYPVLICHGKRTLMRPPSRQMLALSAPPAALERFLPLLEDPLGRQTLAKSLDVGNALVVVAPSAAEAVAATGACMAVGGGGNLPALTIQLLVALSRSAVCVSALKVHHVSSRCQFTLF